MSEVTDSFGDEGQASEAPESVESEFGFDSEDTPDEAPDSPQYEQPEPKADNEAPEEGPMLRADYTRKTQTHADEVREFKAEQARWREEQAGSQAQIQQALATIQAQNSPQSTQPAGLTEQLQEVASSPNLSQEDRAGLNVIANMAAQLEEAQYTIRELSGFRDQVSGQFERTSRAVDGLTQAQSDTLMEGLQAEKASAIESFDQATVEAAMPLVGRMALQDGNWAPPENAATGKPYTIPEMVGMFSGRIAQEHMDARTGHRTAVNGSKKTVAPTGTTSPSGSMNSVSQAEAIAEIAANQRTFA